MNGSSMELAMDRGITDATDEQIIGYIDDCAPVEPYPIDVTLHLDNAEEALAMVEIIADLLRNTKSSFILDIQHAASSTALDRAYVFKHFLALQDMLMASIEKHDLGRWGEMRQFDHYISQA
ncbi:hypothetical protein [Sphingobium sp. UBA5915]|nr:hypothetical protein [Sphingobium sp. UBA5915]MEE2740569.1 hypothetical protein [Pseudomonadota bacterium]